MEAELNCDSVNKKLWLLKVPNNLASGFINSKGNAVGKMQIARSGNLPSQLKMNFLPSKDLIYSSGANSGIVENYSLMLHPVQTQSLVVFSEIDGPNNDAEIDNFKCGTLKVEGAIKTKCEMCPSSTQYLKRKAQQMVSCNKPVRLTKELKTPQQSYKPVAKTAANIETERRAGKDNKRLRLDREIVKERLFAAFEKHQYYNIRHLETITNQPVTYLKEILNEIADYNMKAPHRNMWELKKSFRHYNEPTN